MPGIYPQSGSIGALLRLIEQERKSAPHVRAPIAEPSAPMRKSVAAPLESPIAPESPGTGRVVSIRPEVAPTGAGPARVVAPTTAKMGGIGGIPGETVAPAKPASVSPGEPRPGPATAQAAPQAPRVVKPVAYTPRLATRVTSAPPRRDIGNPMQEARRVASRVEQNIKNIQQQVRKEIENIRKVNQVLAWSASGAPQRARTAQREAEKRRFASSRYERKKAPSVSERLAGWLQPATNWFSRWF